VVEIFCDYQSDKFAHDLGEHLYHIWEALDPDYLHYSQIGYDKTNQIILRCNSLQLTK
jgi:hypothetical protein